MIDMATFDQILEMDDDDDKEFSRAIVTGFLEQAHETFEKMEESLYVFLFLFTPPFPAASY